MTHSLSPTAVLPALASLHACSAARVGEALRALRDVYFPHAPSGTTMGAVPVLKQSLSDAVRALRPKRAARLLHHDGVPDSGYASAEEDDHDEEDDGGKESRNIDAVDEEAMEALEMLRADELERGYAVKWLTGLVKRGDAWVSGMGSPSSSDEQEARTTCLEDASRLLARFAGDDAPEEALTRTFVFPFRIPRCDVSSPPPLITVELNDAPVDGSDHTAVGLQSWGSAIVFAERMCLDPERYLGALHPSPAVMNDTKTRTRRLLELGAGTGLLSITAAQILSRTSVQAEIKTTDYHPSVLENLAWNVRRNPGTVDVSVEKLDWCTVTRTDGDGDEGGGVYDVVLAADVVYYPEHARWIRGCVGRTLSKGGVFWMIIPVRTTGRHEGLEETVEEAFPVVGDGERLAIVRREHVERVDGTESADVNPFKVTPEILTGRKYLVIRVIPEPPNETGRQARVCIAKEFYATVNDTEPRGDLAAEKQGECLDWSDLECGCDGKRGPKNNRGNQVVGRAHGPRVYDLFRAGRHRTRSIQGIAYFSCRPLHGVFICLSQVKVLPLDQPPANPSQTTTIEDFTWQVKSSYTIPSRTTVKPNHASPFLVNQPPKMYLQPLPPLHSYDSTVSPAPSSSQPDKASITVTSTRTTMLSPLAPLTSLPQPQSQPLHQSPVPEPASLLPPAQITPSSSLTSAPASTARSLTNRSGHARAVSITREPSSPNAARTVEDAELQELRAQTRVMEAKRADDARHIRELEMCLNEAESFVALRPKLQAKLNQLQTELIATRRCGGKAESAKAESAQAELEEVKEKLTQMEVELQVLKDGGGKYLYRMEYDSTGDEAAIGKEGEAEAKSSLAYIQLEKHNEHLREALIRLRDISQQTEQDQRRRIAKMEMDITSIDDLQGQYETTLIKLSNNLMLGDKIEDMHIIIENLEALKELNDNLEENHIETEKALQEEINSEDTQIREHLQKISTLEDAFKIWETLSLSSERSYYSYRAKLMSLNLKLQSSAAMNQAKTVRSMYGERNQGVARDRAESDSDATSCYLFFWRMGLKIDLLNTVVGQAHGLPESLHGDVSETVVGICEMRGRAAALAILCKRSAMILRRCDATSFLNIGPIYPEIAPMEKRIEMHIDLLRRDEFREMEFVSDIVKLQAQFDHLTETYFSGFDQDLDPDMFTASIGLTKTSVAAVLRDEDVVLNMGGYDPEPKLFEPLQMLLDQCKNARVLSKTRQAALKAHLVGQLKSLSNAIPELVNFGISLAQRVIAHLSDARSAKSSFQLATMFLYAKQIAVSTVAKDIRPARSQARRSYPTASCSLPWGFYFDGRLLGGLISCPEAAHETLDLALELSGFALCFDVDSGAGSDVVDADDPGQGRVPVTVKRKRDARQGCVDSVEEGTYA
ncbi:hypothetical protein OG21DRAFT_1521951 [Imleria badia]|nr:hypothetical protein OG21DRAFT_1521951 [Imleria badia]